MPSKTSFPEIIDGQPNICGQDADVRACSSVEKKVYASASDINFSNIQSSFGFALHMHQPTIPAGGSDLSTAGLISNLQHMMENQHIGDNHNASVFVNCYSRIADFVRNLVAEGKSPRVMLDYSGNLLWGLRQMGQGGVLENLKSVTCDKKYFRNVEWLGTMWSHAVASSTPVPDLALHIQAFRHHFASIFGFEALERMKGFSAPEMHIPIHPDVCHEYVKALKDNNYEWLMVQEHTIQNLDGSGIRRPHFPHRLVAKNSLGEVAEIAVLVKTQGSDNKLVAQMQPYYEAKARGREDFDGKNLPPFVCQIGDGENGGVMMNEFPPSFHQAYGEIGTTGTVSLNGSEYLEFVKQAGVSEKDFIPVQPIGQHRIWEQVKKFEPGSVDKAIAKVHETDRGFNLDKGSWTNDRSWVKGYEDVLDPVNKLSAAFHQKVTGHRASASKAGETSPKESFGGPDTRKYREALLYLLLSQTSCFRYWGIGVWTDYAQEICRRGMAAVAAI